MRPLAASDAAEYRGGAHHSFTVVLSSWGGRVKK